MIIITNASIFRCKHFKTSVMTGAGSILIGSVMTSSNVLLFVGCLKRDNRFYLPWLVVVMVGVVASFFVAAVLVGVGTLHLVFGENSSEGEELVAVGDLAGVPALAVALMISVLNSELLLFAILDIQMATKE